MHATLAPTGHATEPDQRAEAGLKRRGNGQAEGGSAAPKSEMGGGSF